MSTEPTIYQKKCKGCKKPFTSAARHTRYAPPEVCNCLANRAKHRAKRRKERQTYHRDPERFKALSKTRHDARKLVLAHFGVAVKDARVVLDKNFDPSLGCNSPGCDKNFVSYLAAEIERTGETRGVRQRALKKLLKSLEAHHRDHNPFNNRVENYPLGSNVVLLCRKHHEQADRAKPTVDKDGVTRTHADLVPYCPPKSQSYVAFLVHLRTTNPRRFWFTPTPALVEEYNRS
jgi:hypothetical protein